MFYYVYKATKKQMYKEIEIRVIDRKRVISVISQLKDIDKDKAVKKVLGEAGRVFVIGGKGRLREQMNSGSKGVTRNLLRSFQVKVKRSKPVVLKGFKRRENGGNHVYLVDRGTDQCYWKTRNGKYVGKVNANRFWSETEEQDYKNAIDRLYEDVESAVIKIQNLN